MTLTRRLRAAYGPPDSRRHAGIDALAWVAMGAVVTLLLYGCGVPWWAAPPACAAIVCVYVFVRDFVRGFARGVVREFRRGPKQ